MVIFAPAIHPATHPGGPLGTLGFSHIGPPITYPHSFHARELSEVSGMDHPHHHSPFQFPHNYHDRTPPPPDSSGGYFPRPLASPSYPLSSPPPRLGRGVGPAFVIFVWFRPVSQGVCQVSSGFAWFCPVSSLRLPVPPFLRHSVSPSKAVF